MTSKVSLRIDLARLGENNFDEIFQCNVHQLPQTQISVTCSWDLVVLLVAKMLLSGGSMGNSLSTSKVGIKVCIYSIRPPLMRLHWVCCCAYLWGGKGGSLLFAKLVQGFNSCPLSFWDQIMINWQCVYLRTHLPCLLMDLQTMLIFVK